MFQYFNMPRRRSKRTVSRGHSRKTQYVRKASYLYRASENDRVAAINGRISKANETLQKLQLPTLIYLDNCTNRNKPSVPDVDALLSSIDALLEWLKQLLEAFLRFSRFLDEDEERRSVVSSEGNAFLQARMTEFMPMAEGTIAEVNASINTFNEL